MALVRCVTEMGMGVDVHGALTPSDWTSTGHTGMACRGDGHDDARGQRLD